MLMLTKNGFVDLEASHSPVLPHGSLVSISSHKEKNPNLENYFTKEMLL
jgi:hypothetical protein